MSEWISIAQADSMKDGDCRELVAGDRLVALFRVDGEFHALDGICSHQGGPLGKGELNGCIVTCPWHGWQFDVRTGVQQATTSIRQPTLALKVENGEVFVHLDG